MRVTKTIREYIEKEVSNRLMPKYKADEAEAERRFNVRQEILESMTDEAEAAASKILDKALAEYDFIKDERRENKSYVSIYTGSLFSLKDEYNRDSIFRWKQRFDEEVKAIVNNIIVELELGGDKSTLMALLEKVGE